MSSVGKQVFFYGMKANRALQRSVEKKVEGWIAREQSVLFAPMDSSYFVRIEKEPGRPFVLCHLRVQIGPRIWESYESGKTPEAALLQAVQHLRSAWVLALPHLFHFERVQGAA